MAVTYIPDAAPVRQKMLFASTRLALVRELGSENFRETIFANSADELTEGGFKKHDAHNKLAAPLTEEEQTLGEVKRAEQEAGSGTGTREIHLSKSFAMPMAEDAVAALKELNVDGGRTVVMLVSKITSKSLGNKMVALKLYQGRACLGQGYAFRASTNEACPRKSMPKRSASN